MDNEAKPYQGDYYATIIFPWPLYRELMGEAETLGISTSDHIVRLLKEHRELKETQKTHMKKVDEFMREQREFNQTLSRHLGFFFLSNKGVIPKIPLTFEYTRPLILDHLNPKQKPVNGK